MWGSNEWEGFIADSVPHRQLYEGPGSHGAANLASPTDSGGRVTQWPLRRNPPVTIAIHSCASRRQIVSPAAPVFAEPTVAGHSSEIIIEMNAYHPTRFFVVFSRAAMYLRCLALFICGLFPATALTQNVPPYQSEINQLADRLASENQSQ
jgi:hypothetical protein